jgi:mannosyltransferase
VLIVAMLISLAVQTVSARTPVKENYREAAQYLTDNAQPGDVVVISAPFTIYPIEYYYDGPAALVTLPVWNPYTSSSTPEFAIDRLPEEAEQARGNRARVWLLLSYDQGYEEEVRLYFERRFERLDQRSFSSNLELYLYKTRY